MQRVCIKGHYSALENEEIPSLVTCVAAGVNLEDIISNDIIPAQRADTV
jgi:hypothetical protein